MITVIAVKGRSIIKPFDSSLPSYIDFDHVVAGRFPESTPIGEVMSEVKANHPDAKSFEFYRPNSDHLSAERF